MRNKRAGLALSTAALYFGFAWMSDFIGDLTGRLVNGKVLLEVLIQCTRGVKLVQILLLLLLIAAAAWMNRQNAQRPAPEAWYAAGGFLCISAIFGFFSVLIELASYLTQGGIASQAYMWTTAFSFLASPLAESLAKFLLFLLAWRVGFRARRRKPQPDHAQAVPDGHARTLAVESVILFYGFMLSLQCLNTAIMLSLSATLRDNASNPFGWAYLGIQSAIIAGMAIWQNQRRNRAVPSRHMQPMAYWIAGTVLAVSALRSIPGLIVSLQLLMPPASMNLEEPILRLQQLSFVLGCIAALVSAAGAAAAISLGERKARRSDPSPLQTQEE